MRKFIALYMMCSVTITLFHSCQPSKSAAPRVAQITNPIPLKFGDPFLLHASDGKYYMYGTSLGDGFEAFVSEDLTKWEPCGQVYKGGGQHPVECGLLLGTRSL